MGLTPNQETAVKCAGRPLFIQAGAGTGKTFTLTKRLAYALSQESGPLLESVSNVLTITFTNKAAGELLGRVRAELRAQGMAEAALKIDAAWISTIHSMCQSVLSSHALEAGVDPGATLLAEEATEALLMDALDAVLADPSYATHVDKLYQELSPDEVQTLVLRLAKLVALTPNGPRGFDMGPRPSSNPVVCIRELYQKLCQGAEALEGLGAGGEGSTETVIKQMARIDTAAKLCQSFLAEKDLDTAWSDAAAVLEACEAPKGGRTKAELKHHFDLCADALQNATVEAGVARAREVLDSALEVGTGVSECHKTRKASGGMMDTDDLLMGAYLLLQHFPEIAQEYAQRFRMIMIDEFQDTDSLQVSIITSFCDDMLSTLTTVGDAQQSIYGFRGADLETYRSCRRDMADKDSCEVSLDTNYRSHPDILAFVEAIFSSQEFFGKEFLKIGAGPSNAREYPWAPAGAPRVQMLLAAGEKNPEGRGYTGIASLRKAEAEMIAERFAGLAAQGASYGSMAILMRSTKKASVYLEALHKRGIPCAVSGGSTFYSQPEVRILVCLLRVLELPDDDGPLLELLASPMFNITDSDLLSLRIVARREVDHAPWDVRPRRTLWDALALQAGKIGAVDDPLVRAHALLAEAIASAGSMPLSAVAEHVAVNSGWVAMLQGQGAQGAAIRANILRFEDLLDQYAALNGASVAGAAEYFRAMNDKALAGKGAAGKPGRTVSTEGSAVQIMTIHASKGLEFPIVAVAQYASSAGHGGKGKVLCLTEDGQRRLSLSPSFGSNGTDAGKAHAELGADLESFDKSRSAVSFSAYATALAAERDTQEEQRILYVALTRARDLLLLVSNDASFGHTGKLKKGLFNDIMEALGQENINGMSKAVFTAETGCQVEYEMRLVPYCADEPDEDAPVQVDSVWEVEHLVPEAQKPLAQATRFVSTRAIHSYSSIAHRQETVRLNPYVALRDRSTESDTVSAVGSAFHLVAEWIARHGCAAAPRQLVQQRISSVAARYQLDGEDRSRLEEAVESWIASERFAQVSQFGRLLPEHPFCVDVGGETLEGFIDLLCLDGAGDAALIVDYKTGTSGSGEELRERYMLQARCYAYAVLSSGLCNKVELVFVRPEAGLQEIVYQFEAEDLQELQELILG